MIDYKKISGRYYCECGNAACYEIAEPLEGPSADIFEGSEFRCERCLLELLKFEKGSEHF